MVQSEDGSQNVAQEEEQEQEAETVQVEEQTGDEAEAERPQWTKVVLIQGAMGTTVGVQDADRHPVFTPLSGVNIEEALSQVPELLQAARERWHEQPKYEPYKRPAPAPVQRPARRNTAAAAPANTGEQQPDPQQRLF